MSDRVDADLEDLKVIAITKIKAAYNRSIDLEAAHSVLWDNFTSKRKIKTIIMLILSLVASSSLIFTITFENLTDFKIFLLIFDIFTLIILILIALESFLVITGKSEDHGHIVNGALQLREQSMNFFQYKLDNLDKQGYIEELKSLEISDSNLKEKSAKYTKSLSNKVNNIIIEKIKDLETQGTKKYFMIQEEIDSATEKLQKFTALRTCEAWIKFS